MSGEGSDVLPGWSVPPTVVSTLSVSDGAIGGVLVDRALAALDRREVTPELRMLASIATELAGYGSPLGVDEVTARYLERQIRTALHPAGWSPEKE
jgi:hypothetical protein